MAHTMDGFDLSKYRQGEDRMMMQDAEAYASATYE